MASITSENDPDNNEQMKETVKGIEKKVAKILKLIKNNGPDKKGKIPEDSKKKSELIFLVEDFHKQYKSLYTHYDHLREEMMKKKILRNRNDSSSSGFDSDSEYYSPRNNEEGFFIHDQNPAEESLQNGHKSSSKHPEKEGLIILKKSAVDEQNRGRLVKVHEFHGSKASAQIKELEGELTMMKIELESSRNQKRDLEELLEKKTTEVKRLGETNSVLKSRVSELESGILKKEYKKNEVSGPIKGLKERVDAMQEELRCLHGLKTELELQLELKTREVAEKDVEIESLKEESEQNAMTEQVNVHLEEATEHSVHGGNTKMEELIIRKNQQTEQLGEDKEKLEAKVFELERKLTDTENELSMHQNKQNQVEPEMVNLKCKIVGEETVLKTREDVIKKHRSTDFSPRYRSSDSSRLSQLSADRKIEELAERFQMKMENHIRLLNQRILVAEQIQSETKDGYIKAKKKFEDDNNELNRKIEAWETEIENLRNMLTNPSGITVLTGLDVMTRKLDKDNGDFLNRISRISNELQLARTWITDTNNEMKQLQENVRMLTKKLEEKKEKVEKMEGMKEDGSMKLESEVEELELQNKEKEERLVGLGEEKKEAIRQLCVLIEYHRQRYDQLRQEITCTNLRLKRSV